MIKDMDPWIRGSAAGAAARAANGAAASAASVCTSYITRYLYPLNCSKDVNSATSCQRWLRQSKGDRDKHAEATKKQSNEPVRRLACCM